MKKYTTPELFLESMSTLDVITGSVLSGNDEASAASYVGEQIDYGQLRG